MLKILNYPYPIVEHSRKMVAPFSVVVFCFVFLFIYVFKPFNIEEFITIELYQAGLIFATFSTLGYIVYVKVMTGLFPGWITDEKWNIGRELIFVNSFLVVLTLGNSGIRTYVAPTPNEGFVANVFNDLLYTYSIALFPVLAIVVVRYIAALKKDETIIADNASETETSCTVHSKTMNNEVDLNLNQLVYLKSEGNYVEFYIVENNQLKRLVKRNTLGYIEEQISAYNFLRTHRKYIVNLNKIVHVKGNAQGYRLQLIGTEEKIPVSRSKITLFDRTFGKN